MRTLLLIILFWLAMGQEAFALKRRTTEAKPAISGKVTGYYRAQSKGAPNGMEVLKKCSTPCQAIKG